MKSILKLLVLVLLVAYSVTAFFWCRANVSETMRCKSISLNILDADVNKFITQEELKKEVINLGVNPVGTSYAKLNTQRIEDMLNRNDRLASAECYLTSGGCMVINVTQRYPVMRVFSGNESYYLDAEGNKLTADARYLSDVPVVSGNFTNEFTPRSLMPIIQYITKNGEWDNQVTQIYAQDKRNIYIVPRVCHHIVNIGDTTNLASKFDRLHAVYTNLLPRVGWNTYDTVSVKYNSQIICKRRSSLQKTIVMDEEEVEDGAPLSMLNDSIATQNVAKPKEVKSEAKKSEAKKAEAKKAEAKKAEAKKSEAKKLEAKKENAVRPNKKSDSKTAEKKDNKKLTNKKNQEKPKRG